MNTVRKWPSATMTLLEEYQIAALSLVGLRRQRREESLTSFLCRHDAQVAELNRLWLGLPDRIATPSPDQVISWL